MRSAARSTAKVRGGVDSTESVEARLEVGPVMLTLRVGADDEPVAIELGPSALRLATWSSWEAGSSYVLAIGQDLWSKVFAGAVGLALADAAAEADARGQALTLRVVPVDDPGWERWWQPWELLWDPRQQGHLALARGRSVIRGAGDLTSPRPLPRGRPLRLTAVSLCYLADAPASWRQAFAGVPAEMAWLLDRDASDSQLDVEVVSPDPDVQAFLTLLRTTGSDILHVTGTGFEGGIGARDLSAPMPFPPDQSVGELYRDARPAEDALLAALGRPPSPIGSHMVSAVAIADALAANPAVSLLVLNGCSMEETAQEVARRTGIAVVAHRGTVADNHAAALTKELYPPIIDGLPLDLAVAEARRGLERRFPGQAAWASSTLLSEWPPSRFERTSPGDEELPAGALHAIESAIDTMSLRRLLHQRNMEKLVTLASPGWLPVSSQITDAEKALKGLE